MTGIWGWSRVRTMKLFIAVLFLSLIAGLFSATAKADEDIWEYIDHAEEYDYYFDKTTLTNPSPGVVKVRIKYIKSDFTDLDIFLPLYTVALMQLKCHERQMRFNSMVEYYADRNKAFEIREFWKNITPNSIGESFHKTFCNNH